MRKRRLYRHSVASRFNPRQVPDPEPQEQPRHDSQQLAFQSGIQHGMRLAAMRHQEHAQAQALALASASEARIAQARRASFDRGYSAGIQAAQGQQASPREESSSGRYTYADVEAARKRGFAEGRKTAPAAPSNESSIRKKMIDEMVEQCRVISESNPQMAPGVNAVKHMIKKLG